MAACFIYSHFQLTMKAGVSIQLNCRPMLKNVLQLDMLFQRMSFCPGVFCPDTFLDRVTEFDHPALLGQGI